ncbi:UDP-2,3-diacylglucosamine diphosphatase [Alteromonas sp. ASW11-130]|uniref:UDP-2,3-diacylglucosamine diphosphatase n=1 Tax=Alteromonas sp. ASW11-130 TaxID=3015775 RepID=UPI0022421F9B|nr:UDP-2,3-diacylglucosamine diphosphatase [Alteromonas sp. ASW11-130]MCW8092598.1 UDP-2,3-diacylglucosamine diphosphatase [Alteromonas sp. ASW11-130]
MNFTYFISDLHLSEAYPYITQCLIEFLSSEAPEADALYVLGDLFDVWIGDDNVTPFNESIAAAFKKLSKVTPVYFIHGNRDFAIREGWTDKAGMTLLPEQCVIDLYGEKTLLTHGDELCTLDVEYQKFRRKSRGWWWPRLMLSLPLWLRRKIAEDGRQKSQQKQQKLSTEIMDVTPDEVVKVMEKHQVQRLIHGHTHRPNIHTLEVNGKPATRIVLGDWYEQGSILKVSALAVELEKRSFAATSIG